MSKYFTPSEMACPCCGRVFVDDRLFPILDRIREAVGQPVFITSGYRCPSHNAEVGGVANSQHLDGTAADITYDGVDVEKLTDIAIDAGASGVGSYFNQGFVHVDCRLATWDDNT